MLDNSAQWVLVCLNIQSNFHQKMIPTSRASCHIGRAAVEAADPSRAAVPSTVGQGDRYQGKRTKSQMRGVRVTSSTLGNLPQFEQQAAQTTRRRLTTR